MLAHDGSSARLRPMPPYRQDRTASEDVTRCSSESLQLHPLVPALPARRPMVRPRLGTRRLCVSAARKWESRTRKSESPGGGAGGGGGAAEGEQAGLRFGRSDELRYLANCPLGVGGIGMDLRVGERGRDEVVEEFVQVAGAPWGGRDGELAAAVFGGPAGGLVAEDVAFVSPPSGEQGVVEAVEVCRGGDELAGGAGDGGVEQGDVDRFEGAVVFAGKVAVWVGSGEVLVPGSSVSCRPSGRRMRRSRCSRRGCGARRTSVRGCRSRSTRARILSGCPAW
jgi:hypothetical protein